MSHEPFYQRKHENWKRHIGFLGSRANPHAFYPCAFRTNWRFTRSTR